MSQKDYKMEIIEKLLKGNNHIRELARNLKTNQTTVSRKIKELEKDNVVDYKQEGKNKVYFLKKTIEAQEYTYLEEHYRLLQLLGKYSLLRKIVQRIQSVKGIKLAILFGSYAKGKANKISDIDVYVETKSRKVKEEIELLNTRLSVKIGKYDRNAHLAREIEKDHVIIKGVESYYEKSRVFG